MMVGRLGGGAELEEEWVGGGRMGSRVEGAWVSGGREGMW
jgi:hypothetical protein